MVSIGPAYSQPAKDMKVSVKELKTYTAPDVLENPDLKSLPSNEEWVQPAAYRWFVMNGTPSKNPEFPAGCPVEVQKGPDNSLQIKKDDRVFQKNELQDLEQVVASPDGSMVMLYYSEISGDVSRYTIWLVDLDKGKEAKITSEPVGLAEFSPDSKYIVLEGVDLIDASVEKRTAISLGQFTYPDVLGWSKDGSKLILLSYDNWEDPQYAIKYLISLK